MFIDGNLRHGDGKSTHVWTQVTTCPPSCGVQLWTAADPETRQAGFGIPQ